MPQPTAVELFGTGATISGGNLTVPLSGLTTQGLSGTAPIEVLGAILSRSADWFIANTDEAVMATATRDIFSPATRNSIQKTQYNMNFALYGSYTAPTFDPDDL